MNRLALAAAIISSTLFIAGCGQGGESSSATSTELTADEVLETFVEGLRPLQSVGETDGDPATEFRQVTEILTPLVAPLTEGIEGVPEDVTTDAAVATGSLTVSIDLVTECLSTESLADECDPLISNSVTQAQSLGQAMAEIVPYSTWTIDELIQAIS